MEGRASKRSDDLSDLTVSSRREGPLAERRQWSEPIQAVLFDDRARLLDHGAGAVVLDTLNAEVSPAYHYLSPARTILPSNRPETFDPVQASGVRLLLYPGPGVQQGQEITGWVRVRTTSSASP